MKSYVEMYPNHKDVEQLLDTLHWCYVVLSKAEDTTMCGLTESRIKQVMAEVEEVLGIRR